MRKEPPPRRTRQKRQLPEPLRPLAGLVELANLIEEEEENRLRSAHQRLDEATGEILARNSGAVSRTDQTLASLRKQAQTAGEEMQHLNTSGEASLPVIRGLARWATGALLDFSKD